MNRYSNRALDTSYIGVGATPSETSWVNAITAATQALAALAAKAVAARAIATDETQAGLAEATLNFATKSGPTILKKAFDRGDGNELKRLQGVTRNMAGNLSEGMKDAAVQRFLLLSIPIVGPIAASLPASAIGLTKEAIRDLELPPEAHDASADILFYAKIGLGIAAITWVAYVVKAFR